MTETHRLKIIGSVAFMLIRGLAIYVVGRGRRGLRSGRLRLTRDDVCSIIAQ